MGAQDKTERVLRDIHVLFSKAEPYEGSKKNVIIDKTKAMDLIRQLNDCMYEMMDEHEISAKSRDKANREMQKQGDDIVFNAQRQAEDIYAASLMYSDNALSSIQDIMKEASEDIQKIYDEAQKKIKEETKNVRTNQLELKSHLNDLIDTQKYLKLIDEENMRIAKAKAEGTEEELDAPKYSAPEIRVNKEYFEQQGLRLDEEEVEAGPDLSEQEMADLDAEYFAWQEEGEGKKEESTKKKPFGLFGKK